MARAALYLRVSSLGQEENYSLPGQEEDGRRWCAQNGHDVVFVFNDGAQKSYTLDRNSLNKAILHAKQGDFDILIVGRYDRLSRNQVQQQVIVNHLQKYGVGVVSTCEPVPEGAIGDFVRSSYAFAAEVELYNTRSRTTGGKKARIRAGKILAGCHPLYGYIWANATDKRGKDAYLPDPETAWVVKLIYELVMAGHPLRAISRELEAWHIPTPGQILAERGQLQRGRTCSSTWRLSTLTRILSNSAYIGKHSGWKQVRQPTTARDRITGEMRTITRQIILSPDDPERVYLPAEACPALVDDETFQAAQQVLAHNRELSSRRLIDPEKILLRGGLAVCGWCGRNLQARLDRKRYYRYYCGATNNPGNPLCANRRWSVKVDDLDRQVWNWVVRAFSQPEIIRGAFERWKANQAEGRAVEYDRLESVQTALTSVTNRWRNCLTSAAEARDEDTRAQFSHMANEAGKEIHGLQKEYDQLVKVLGRADGRMEQLDSLIEMGSSALEHLRTASYQDKRTLLYALGVVVKVKSMTDYIVDWRLEWIQERWVQRRRLRDTAGLDNDVGCVG